MDGLSHMDDLVRALAADPTVLKIVSAVLFTLFVFVAIRLIRRAAVRRIRDSGLRYRARKVLNIAGALAVMLFLGSLFSDKFGNVTVALGIAGAGIAFALQGVIMSFAGWIAIVFGDYYKTGDRIKLKDIRGDVIDIGVLRTTLMECGEWVNGDLYSGRIVRLANSNVFSDVVFNYSDDFPFLWDEITVPIRFGSDAQHARDLVLGAVTDVVGAFTRSAAQSWEDVVEKYRIENARLEPMVTVRFDENWMTFTARYIVDYRLRRTTQDQIFSGVLSRVEASDGRVQIASTSVDVALTPDPTIRLEGSQQGGADA